MQDLNKVTEVTLDATNAQIPTSEEPEQGDVVAVVDPGTRLNPLKIELPEPGSIEEAHALEADPTKKAKLGRQIAKERLLAMLAGTLKAAGFSERVVYAVGAVVAMQDTKINTDFAFNPATGIGSVWGFSNGGACKLPFDLGTGEVKAGAVRLVDGKSVHPAVSRKYVTVFGTGYWIVQFSKATPVEQEQLSEANRAAETGVVEETPLRGHTETLTHIDELPYANNAPEIELSGISNSHNPKPVKEDEHRPDLVRAAAMRGVQALKQIHDVVGGLPKEAPAERTVSYIDEAPFIPNK